MAEVVAAVKSPADSRDAPVVIVHGGGKVIAGTTPGVLDTDGATLPVLDAAAATRLVNSGAATAGMIAKLRACEQALTGGVDEVVIVDGRNAASLVDAATGAAPPAATRLI